MFVSDTLPHNEEETQEKGVVNIEGGFYRGCQNHTQTAHFPKWHSQGCKQEHNEKASQVPNGTSLKQASAPRHQPPVKYLLFRWQISFFHILDTLEVRSQKGNAETTGPFHHPLDVQKAQGQQPEDYALDS